MNADRGEPAAADIQKKIAAVDFDGALRDIDKRLTKAPEDPEALYMAAVCYRYTKQYDKAQN